MASSSSLYTGGIVLNDFFDYEIDKRENPGRSLPSGRIRRDVAGLLGFGLLLCGVLFSLSISTISFVIALCIALLVISYNSIMKRVAIIGPFNMGLCRYMNFVLGMTLYLVELSLNLVVPVILLVYIMVITFVSLEEATNLKIQKIMRWMILSIIPINAVIAMIWAGIGYGILVLILLIPSYLSSRILYMT